MEKLNHISFKDVAVGLNIRTFMTCSSFEERCFIIPQLLPIDQEIKKIFFYNTNEDKVIISNAERLVNENTNSEKIPLNSDDPIDNYTIIDSLLEKLNTEKDKGNILIDITTFTHETLLILLKAIEINRELLNKVYIAYVGAGDYSYNLTDDGEKWLSKGIKTIRTVLGYPGLTDPSKKNHLMILFGFESERTKRIIEEYEFDKISLGFAKISESVQSNHYKINYARHKELLNEFPNASEFQFSLIDAAQTKKDILDYLKTNQLEDLNTVIAPLNTKISTLGAGLAAIENEKIQLAYAKPNIYNVNGYAKANEDIYLEMISFT